MQALSHPLKVFCSSNRKCHSTLLAHNSLSRRNMSILEILQIQVPFKDKNVLLIKVLYIENEQKYYTSCFLSQQKNCLLEEYRKGIQKSRAKCTGTTKL